MRDRKYNKKGLGVSTIIFMIFSIGIMVLPANVAAVGTWQNIYIDGVGPCSQGGTYDVNMNDIVEGEYANAGTGVTFSWTVDEEDWQPMDSVVYDSRTSTYDFWFEVDGVYLQSSGILYLQATVGAIDHNWWCYYY
jgi:hypothetical protein